MTGEKLFFSSSFRDFLITKGWVSFYEKGHCGLSGVPGCGKYILESKELIEQANVKLERDN